MEGVFELTVFSLSILAAVFALLSSVVGYVIQRRQKSLIFGVQRLRAVAGQDVVRKYR